MAKARRKMRRQLMKKLKKGYLTPGEREDLMELDREVNRANRQAAGMTGAGLGSALLIASKMGAGDALGDWLDTRQKEKEVEDESVELGERLEMEDEGEAPETLDIEKEDFQEEEPQEDDRKSGQAAMLSDYSPEEVEALIRYDLQQAQGGYTPFLKAMRDRMRKKYGSR